MAARLALEAGVLLMEVGLLQTGILKLNNWSYDYLNCLQYDPMVKIHASEPTCRE